MIHPTENYNPGENCWSSSHFSLSPHYNVEFHGLRNQDPFIDRSHVSTLSVGKGGAKKAATEEHALLI